MTANLAEEYMEELMRETATILGWEYDEDVKGYCSGDWIELASDGYRVLCFGDLSRDGTQFSLYVDILAKKDLIGLDETIVLDLHKEMTGTNLADITTKTVREIIATHERMQKTIKGIN